MRSTVNAVTVLLLAAAVSCSGGGAADEAREDMISLSAEEATPQPLQYMAVCPVERAALTPWVDRESEARGALSKHEQALNHEGGVLWRETPQASFGKPR